MQNLGAPTKEQEKREIMLKNIYLKVESADSRLENYRNINWWISQHLRFCYRKKAYITQRFQDTIERLKWNLVEFTMIERLKYHIEYRQRQLGLKKDTEMIRDWLKTYHSNAIQQLIQLDSQQETILNEEINRLDRDYNQSVELDSIVEELMKSLEADSQYVAEKIYLDQQLKIAIYGSERAVQLNEQMIALKTKQEQLATSAIDTLKLGLQQKYDEEDEANVDLFSFPNDDPDLPVQDMHKISATILNKYVPISHFKLSDFLDVYMMQPWLALQSVEDVRLEERISSLELKLGKLQEELKNLKLKIKDGEHKLKRKEKRKVDASVQLEHLEELDHAELDDESEEDKAARRETIASLRSVRTFT